MFNFYYFVVQGRCFKVYELFGQTFSPKFYTKLETNSSFGAKDWANRPILRGESPKSRGEPTFLTKKRVVLPKSQNNPFKSYNRNYLLCLRHQPLLEFRYTRLRDNNLLGQRNGQIEREATAKPYGNILHGTACYDELSICAEELILGQSRLQHLKRTVDLVAAAIVGVG